MKTHKTGDAPKHRSVRPSSTTPQESPRQLEPAAHAHVRFRLHPRLPFRLDLTVWALRRRPSNGIDRWDGATYSRVLVVGGQPFLVALTRHGTGLEVTLTGPRVSTSVQSHVTTVLERLLGLRQDLHEFYACAAHDPRLNGLVRRFSGLKPPRLPTVFEALLNGITCQQLSLTVGILLLSRLAQCCGLAVLGFHACPRPEDLVGVAPEQLRRLGYSRQKSRAILDLAQACVDRAIDLEALSKLNDADAVTRLLELRGVGRWTAEYVLLRGLGRTHIFPGDDVGARNNLQRWLHRSQSLDYQAVHRALVRWKPYSGLIYFHLLLDRLEEAGVVS
ncbi:MAG: DNA-3-methyladenine glycosylase family protein [Nitrospiraceae bacterium]